VEVIVMEREAPGGTPLAMRVRRLWPDRNPLRRAADRAEFAVAALLLAAFFAGVPLTAPAAAHWAAVSGVRSERAQAGIFLDWRRMAAWDADWAMTEPQWSGRY
jgi:hypothetical protein